MINQFPDCGAHLNLYPLVDDHNWLKPMFDLGVTSAQLRIKDKDPQFLENEIVQAIAIAKSYNARLFINDYWQLAIKHHAYGVHLGQDDLATADIPEIYNAGLRLGISTHSPAEITTAINFKPSYLAFGPIFPTNSKILPYPSQGVQPLAHWARELAYPLVAIGGIDLTRIPSILKAGVDGIAVISAISKAPDPLIMTKAMLEIINNYREENAK